MTATGRTRALLAALLVIGVAGLLAARPAVMSHSPSELSTMMPSKIKHMAAAALAWLGPASAGLSQQPAAVPLPPAPPTAIGMNAPAIGPAATTVPFANLAIGSDWVDSKYHLIGEQRQDRHGNILSMPPGGYAQRLLSIPPTGPEPLVVNCTYQGSGSFRIFGVGEAVTAKEGLFRFRVVNQREGTGHGWLIVSNFNPAKPLRDLDCREAGVPRAQRFRSSFLATLRGYRVVRFMDWQNANGNQAVSWAGRHVPGDLGTDADGVPIEDMLALARELDVDPWFVMPWNADDDYITRFARLVHDGLPSGRHAYVEVGNEVWNGGFAVANQAIAEGQARGLGNGIEAGMRRYAQRTGEVMRLWEAVFAGTDRHRLVRVLSTQHAWTGTAELALKFGDTAAHVDALATAPYFGPVLGGLGNTRDSAVASLRAALPVTLQQAVSNRRVATAFGKRYIAYEGGESLGLPAQQPLLWQLQHDPVQYDLYQQYLAGWRKEVGDTLCLLTSVSPPGGSGAWGLAAWEDETPAEAPKWRAVRDAMAAR